MPVWEFAAACLARGELPTWFSGQYAGTPFLYHQEAPIFYPLTVPLLLSGLPAHRAADLFTLFHLVLAGAASFALCFSRTRRMGPSAFGGAAWMLSARTIQSALWPNAVTVAALLPLLALGLLWIGEGRRRAGVALAAVAGGLALLSARPQSFLGTVPVLAAIACHVLLSASSRWRAAGDLALAGLLALGLGSPSLFPTAALHGEMERANGLSVSERDQGSVPARDLDLVFLRSPDRGRYPEARAYPGAVTYALVAAGLFLLARPSAFPRRLFAAILLGGAVGLLFSAGESGPYRYLSWLPLLNGVRVPARYLHSWGFALVPAAALVAAELERRAARSGFGRAGGWLGWAATALLLVDLVPHVRQAAPVMPAGIWAATPRLARYLTTLPKDDAGFPTRLWSSDGDPPPHRFRGETLAGSIERWDPLWGASGSRFGVETLSGWGPKPIRIRDLLATGRIRAAEIAAVSRLTSSNARQPLARDDAFPPPPLLFRVPSPLPRAFAVPGAILVPSGQGLAAALDDRLDLRQVVVLEPPAAARATGPWSAPATVRLVSREGARLVLDATLPGDGYVVVADTYSKGWTSRVDGVETPVLLANGVFRAVAVPAGPHRIEMRFEATGVREGAGLFVAAALGLTLVFSRLGGDAGRPQRPNTAAATVQK